MNKMDTMDLEANWENLEAVVEHREAPKEEATVENLEQWRSSMGTGI
jgi:ribonuclease D